MPDDFVYTIKAEYYNSSHVRVNIALNIVIFSNWSWNVYFGIISLVLVINNYIKFTLAN